jgi:hypothetical protein
VRIPSEPIGPLPRGKRMDLPAVASLERLDVEMDRCTDFGVESGMLVDTLRCASNIVEHSVSWPPIAGIQRSCNNNCGKILASLTTQTFQRLRRLTFKHAIV